MGMVYSKILPAPKVFFFEFQFPPEVWLLDITVGSQTISPLHWVGKHKEAPCHRVLFLDRGGSL